MADITTNTLKIGSNNLILRDADAQAKVAVNTQDITELKEDLDALIRRGTGLNDTQKALIITILRNALYSSDQSDNIDELEDTFARYVTSVSAVIDLEGNTIYTDDTLDTLRQYLTVTATFDDSTSETVAGYSLAGTLTVGTSTITVTYRDVSSTVSVPVSQAIVRYNITNNLTGVTNSNTDTTIAEGNTYTGVLSAETSGYIPTGVIVTVGGTDVTSTVYNSTTYTITIPSVDGDITITASEAIEPPTPVYRGQNLVFDGTASTVIDTGIKLCDTDKDITVVVEFDTPLQTYITSNACDLFSCVAGSADKDGYVVRKSGNVSTPMYAFGTDGTPGWTDAFNALEGETQAVIIRHQASSGTVEFSGKAYKNNAISVVKSSKSVTFAAHDNTAIIGARRWNGINSIASGTLKLVEIYDEYLTDEQIAGYYE